MTEKLLLNDRYLLDEFISKGGMARVYKGRDQMLERDVAIKVLREDYSKDPAFRERFRQEAKAAANLSHSNIVTIFDFGFDEDRLFIVMEYVPGEDLYSLIKKNGHYSLEDGIPLIVQACKGLGYAHRAGLVHCDIKPHNFMVTPDGRVKITDFGIARALASINPKEERDVVWGSPQYFAPEMAAGNAPTLASDVYSMGVIMYYLFAGRLPFEGKNSSELSKMHQNEIPLAPNELNPSITQKLNDIILKVLSKEPAARYRTADQLGRVLINMGQEMAIQLEDSQEFPAESSQNTGSDEVDWMAVGLGLLAVLTVGGLLPFSMWVYLVFNPPIR
jgi:serine/threonine-protein kinase